MNFTAQQQGDLCITLCSYLFTSPYKTIDYQTYFISLKALRRSLCSCEKESGIKIFARFLCVTCQEKQPRNLLFLR